MSKRGDEEFLPDISEAIKRIRLYTSKTSCKRFFADTMIQDAVIRNLEIIGEAVKNISPALKKQHQEIEWKKIAGMRDKIIHFYFGVNLDIVWQVLQDELPDLGAKIETILETLGQSRASH